MEMEDRYAALEPWYRTFGTWLIRWLYRPQYCGFEKLPATGAAILVCNHVSYADGPLIAAAVGRKVRFVIYEPIYRLPLVHHFMRVNRAIPIFPTREKVRRALDAISEGLRQGDLICIFPEGQRTATGSLMRFRPGIEYIIQRDPVPVYPVAITGLWGSMFSRKLKGSWRRFLPRKPGTPVVAVCGDAIPGEEVTVNLLQEAVLRLKYRGSS
jgi:1-acyl-sn-glycerol-3-phosphate acyltransferase